MSCHAAPTSLLVPRRPVTSPREPAVAVVVYDRPIEAAVAELTTLVAGIPALAARHRPRWLAVALLEGDSSPLDDLAEVERTPLLAALAIARAQLGPHYGDELDLAIADARYTAVARLIDQAVTRPATGASLSERIDRIVLHRVLGIPIFLVLLFIIFSLVQSVAAPYVDWLDTTITGPVTRWLMALLIVTRAPDWLQSLVIDGLLTGVGGVVTFLPGLLALYTALALLESSGYLARGAFVVDRALGGLGLHGKSFIPLILGFGCNVPAIYATRVIDGRGARLLTGLLVPFMSCTARLPVYLVVALAFFPEQAYLVVWTLHVTSVATAALVGGVLARTVFREADANTVVMELPPYRLPTLGSLLRQTWRNTAAFLRRAGTVILAASSLLWLALHLPWGVTDPADSLFGQVSRTVAPTLAPAGFGTWQASGALLAGVAGKEVVVATLAQVFLGGEDQPAAPEVASAATVVEDVAGIVTGLGQATLAAGGRLLPGVQAAPAAGATPATALSAVLPRHFSVAGAWAFLIFVLLYVPCIATVSAQAQEFGGRWALRSAALSLGVAWAMAVLVYQAGRLLGGG